MKMKMMKSILPYLLLFFVCSLNVTGQSSLPYSGIQLLERYQTVLSKGNFSIESTKSEFKSLFLYSSDKTVVLNDIGEFKQMNLISLDDFIDSMVIFNKTYLIDTVLFSNYKLERLIEKKDFLLYQVSLDKRIIYKYLKITKKTALFKVVKDAKQVFTLLILKGDNLSNSYILKISDKIDVFGPYFPESIEFNMGFSSPTMTAASVLFDKSKGFSAALDLNFLIGGKRNINFYFSPGFTLSRFSVEHSLLGSYFEKQQNKLDIDKYPYTDSISFNNIRQQSEMTILSIPLKFSFVWNLNKNWNIGTQVGLSFCFPLYAQTNTTAGTLSHVGIYRFPNDPKTYYFNDLDTENYPYGFGNYPAKSKQLGKSIGQFISIPLNISTGYVPENKNYAITARIGYNVGVSSVVKVGQYIGGFKGEILPVYCQDPSSKLNDLTVSLGFRYYLSKPRIPYYKNIYWREIKTKVDKINTGSSGEIEFNEPLQPFSTQIFVGKPSDLKEISKLSYYVDGIGKKSRQEGKLKVGSNSNQLKLKIPVSPSAKENCELVIRKPFGYNIYLQGDSLGVYADQTIPELRINLRESLDGRARFILGRIPDFHFVYVNTYGLNVENKEKLRLRLEELQKEISKEDFLFQLSLPSPVFHSSKNPDLDFYNNLIHATATLGVTDIEDLRFYLEKNNIKLERRNVFIHLFFLQDKNLYPEIKKLINGLFETEGIKSNSHKTFINIYTNLESTIPLDILGVNKKERIF